MRITDKKTVRRLVKQGRISKDALKIIEESNKHKSGESAFQNLIIDLFGDYFNGGDAVFELTGVIPGKQYRFDAAIVSRRVLIELDGFRDHGMSLKGFKRDRIKSLLATVQGWHVIHITTEIVKKESSLLKKAVTQFPKRDDSMEIVRYRDNWTKMVSEEL